MSAVAAVTPGVALPPNWAKPPRSRALPGAAAATVRDARHNDRVLPRSGSGRPSAGPATPGAAYLPRARLDEMIAAYYRARGWTVDGRVPRSLRRSLGLDDPAFGTESP